MKPCVLTGGRLNLITAWKPVMRMRTSLVVWDRSYQCPIADHQLMADVAAIHRYECQDYHGGGKYCEAMSM
jgi:hypothetical protein